MLVVIAQTTSSMTTMQSCAEEEMMLNQNFSIMDEDNDAAVPVGTVILPGTTMPSKLTSRSTGWSFGRMVAHVGAGLLLLLLLAEGADPASSSPDRGAGRRPSRSAKVTVAAEKGAARTPRRHRRNMVTKKNPQQVPPTENGAVVEVVESCWATGTPCFMWECSDNCCIKAFCGPVGEFSCC